MKLVQWCKLYLGIKHGIVQYSASNRVSYESVFEDSIASSDMRYIKFNWGFISGSPLITAKKAEGFIVWEWYQLQS